MGGGTDGTSSLLVGLPGRTAEQKLHAEVTSGTLLLSISGPGIEAMPLTARGMRCISQASGAGSAGAGSNSLLPPNASIPITITC